MEHKPDEKKTGRGVSRRSFLGTIGATAAALGLGGPQPAAASEAYYFQDSFGNTAAADPSLIGLGIVPPAPPGGGGGLSPDLALAATAPSSGWPQYNILLIVVDQMRNPSLWLPSGNNWLSTYGAAMPNVTQLASRWSFMFPNYFVAATACTPSRACMLTGLYSQQTCIFATQIGGAMPPNLLPFNNSWTSGDGAGFPSIGNVLSQSFGGNGYECAWIGKWNLSGNASGPGANGPSDYGFGSIYNIPTTDTSNPYPGGTSGAHLAYSSPNGDLNEGGGADFLDTFTQTTPAHDIPGFGWASNNSPMMYYGNAVAPPSGVCELSDAAIAQAFTNFWLPYANNSLNGGGGYPGNNALATPWFCAVSFINPHDITDFPWSFGLIQGNNNFTFSANNHVIDHGYQPPPISSSNQTYNGTDSPVYNYNTTIRGFNNLYSAPPPGAGNTAPWNYEGLSSKPGLQAYYQGVMENDTGVIQSPGSYNSSNNSWNTPDGWVTFLNYYTWLQSCMDYQVGQVLGTNPGSGNTTPPGLAQSAFNDNTVIIFTADHGDYGGSHGLKGKSGALYEEAINVPLIVSFPSARNANNSANNGYPLQLPYACSSVDLLPFLYTLALGNEGWRSNNNDMIYYLAGRESIFDAVLYYNNVYSYPPYPGLQHRRISGIPLYNNNNAGHPYGNANWQVYQPFVLHTTDEFPQLSVGNTHPAHAVGFRTVDQTEVVTSAAPTYGQTSYGGGKLGAYTVWDASSFANGNAPIVGNYSNSASPPPEFEFYNYFSVQK